MAKEFTTIALTEEQLAKRHKKREEDATLIVLDGEELKFYYPGPAAALVMGSTLRNRMTGENIANMMALFLDRATEETREHINERLMDDDDPFGIETDDDDETAGLFDIFNALVEDWSGKAEAEQAGSAKSRASSGTRSTANSRAKASTSSRSRSRGSSR